MIPCPLMNSNQKRKIQPVLSGKSCNVVAFVQNAVRGEEDKFLILGVFTWLDIWQRPSLMICPNSRQHIVERLRSEILLSCKMSNVLPFVDNPIRRNKSKTSGIGVFNPALIAARSRFHFHSFRAAFDRLLAVFSSYLNGGNFCPSLGTALDSNIVDVSSVVPKLAVCRFQYVNPVLLCSPKLGLIAKLQNLKDKILAAVLVPGSLNKSAGISITSQPRPVIGVPLKQINGATNVDFSVCQTANLINAANTAQSGYTIHTALPRIKLSPSGRWQRCGGFLVSILTSLNIRVIPEPLPCLGSSFA